MHPIACASRSLSKAERNYGITEMEALGVVWGARHFRAYLYGHKCIVYTNHSPLRSMLKAQHPSGKLARWSQSLCEFDLELRYRPGRVNSNADALSMDSSDHREDDDAEVQSVEEEQQPMSEVAELQRADEVIGPMVRCLCEDAELDDSVVSKVMLMERDRLVLLDGVLYYRRLQNVCNRMQNLKRLLRSLYGRLYCSL